jgi:hypothetical protein
MKNSSLCIWTTAFLSILAGGAILILFILVPFWQTLSPDAFMEWVKNFGNRLGFTMLPMEMIPFLLSIAAYFVAKKANDGGKNLWLGVMVCNVIVLAMLLIYFIPVNLSFINKTIAPENVPGELVKWKMIHTARTIFIVLSMVLGILATGKNMKKQSL